ncbi:purine-nucleoside phosphorylase [Elusimicrobiota bacterium]
MSIGIILGSGLGGAVNYFSSVKKECSFEEFLGIDLGDRRPPKGHHRNLLKVTHKGKTFWILQGRLHYYEGFSMDTITSTVRSLNKLGVDTLVLSFACGSINRKLRVGDFIALKDHIHLQSGNPLRGTTNFIDCTNVYDEALRKNLLSSAKKEKARAFPGVYISLDGPTYETPAEIMAYKAMGADVVGMSVTCEALVARSLDMKLAGFGWVSNLASGIAPKCNLSHQEVLDMGAQVEKSYGRVLKRFIDSII